MEWDAAPAIVLECRVSRLVLRAIGTCIAAALSSDATLDDLDSLIVETAASFAPVSFDRRLSAEWGLVQEEGRAMRE